MDILNRDSKVKPYWLIFLIICVVGCNNEHKFNYENSKNKIVKQSVLVLAGTGNYNKMYRQMSDTLEKWLNHKLIADTVYDDFTHERIVYECKIDSVFCVNSTGSRIIGALHHVGFSNEEIPMDEILEFYGEKINGKWYFWTGGAHFVLRKSLKGHDLTKPLPYRILREMAIREILGGYLTKDGQINEEWFVHHFEKDGWGTFENRYEYKYLLDGQRIDNEEEYWKYVHKRKGLGKWIGKMTRDSINRVNQTLKPDHITREEENEISMYFSRKLVNGK